MYRKIEDFGKNLTYEVEMTSKVLRALTDTSLEQPIETGGRTLGFLAMHLAVTIREMLGQAGLRTAGPGLQDPVPASASEIAAIYEQAAATILPAVQEAWTDMQLDEPVPMYGESWAKGIVLSAFLFHQAHHRGQMTVLMRQAGLPVPGIYGPSREEWTAMGLPPHK
jgi:uncharacterized damage-inducible protein DinB